MHHSSSYSVCAQIISKYILCLRGQDGLIRDLEEVRTAGKRTILCYTETNPSQVSMLNTF